MEGYVLLFHSFNELFAFYYKTSIGTDYVHLFTGKNCVHLFLGWGNRILSRQKMNRTEGLLAV